MKERLTRPLFCVSIDRINLGEYYENTIKN